MKNAVSYSSIASARRVGLSESTPWPIGVDADRLFVIAAAGGADDNPYWFHNVVAHPQVIVEVGADTLRMQASIAAEPERTRLFDKFATERPGFRDYQALTTRILPVVILSRV